MPAVRHPAAVCIRVCAGSGIARRAAFAAAAAVVPVGNAVRGAGQPRAPAQPAPACSRVGSPPLVEARRDARAAGLVLFAAALRARGLVLFAAALRALGLVLFAAALRARG